MIPALLTTTSMRPKVTRVLANRFRVEEHLRSGRLEEVLTDWPSPGLPVSVLYPYHRQLSPRVKVFVEWVSALYAERFAPPEATRRA
ncbi:LysR substrate-binding domain-containing protein [Azotobacter chroococcum]|uniref:LysR substrate-binding domain-containing protein n=1 Tax=Azotobacter chroococcum TaxID=353 RepID=UPI0031015637